MSETIKASSAADFTPETALYELGRRNSEGKPLRVRVAAVRYSKISAFFGGLPSASAGEPQASKVDAKRDAAWREIIREGAVEPRIRFSYDEPGDGVVWDDLDIATQLAWQNAICEHSGLKLPEEANALATFRVVERGGEPVVGAGGGGLPDGSGARGPLPTGEAAA